jgi:hypothetical protein
MSSTPCDRVVVRCPNTRHVLLELLWYALHLNIEKLKVNRFLVGLNVNIPAQVRILFPQTLHDVFHKALIVRVGL